MPIPVSKPRRDPTATRRLWAERLERFRRSGQTVAQFCDAEGVSAPSFYVWKRTLAAESVPPPPIPTVVPIRLTRSSPTPPTAAIELSLPSGAVLRLPADIRADLLVAVLRGVEGQPCGPSHRRPSCGSPAGWISASGSTAWPTWSAAG